ncbi:MAG: aminotransferase class I/II-fold pyridoxal phosphate-dependent enzyme [Bacteroidota bacterium]
MIPLHDPYISQQARDYMNDCLNQGWISSSGMYVGQFEDKFSQFTNLPCSVAIQSGTAALHLALLTLGVKKGEVVIAPDLTFVASINAISYTGAEPLLVDANESNWQMDLDVLEEFLIKETEVREDGCYWAARNRKISCIMAVHVLGYIGNMPRLKQICVSRKIALLEDASEALGSTKGKFHAGHWGDASVFSFNGNKALSTGGGGMICFHDPDRARVAKHLSTQAKKDEFWYDHDQIGFNTRMTALTAAFGCGQLAVFEEKLSRKVEIARRYMDELSSYGEFPTRQVDDHPNFWLNTLKTERQRALIKKMREAEVQVRPLWKPMHELSMYRSAHYLKRDKSVSHQLHLSCLSLPSSPNLSEQEQEQVIQVFYQ